MTKKHKKLYKKLLDLSIVNGNISSEMALSMWDEIKDIKTEERILFESHLAVYEDRRLDLLGVSACVAGMSLATALKTLEKQNKMKQKELVIEIPKGHEIDQEKSTYEKIVFKEVKKVATYNDLEKNFIKSSTEYYTLGSIINYGENYCSSKGQLESIQALNKLCNVAKYLNDGWLPNWSLSNELKWFLISDRNKNISVSLNRIHTCSVAFFKSKKLAQQAIEILGEEEVRKALTLNH